MSHQRYLCIHNHYYQPPRENPWLEEIEYQESAHPYHDWNERISAECYRPNGLSRILDAEGWVTALANNYSKISFNFGPTLLSWMIENDPLAYEAILEGDRLSRERFDGHGSAIAQGYNHMILPLANRRDKETQIIWGLRDFEKHFSRPAEAMWLPETAVDTETLEILSYHGMQYVILAPRQARAVRPVNTKAPWQEINENRIDPKHPYLVKLPSGRSIAAFFYDGPISQAVAFEKLLNNGETFAKRLMQGFSDQDQRAQLLHIATDGETYGHHHRHGDMALAYALDYIENNNLATVTNYGYFLSHHPPRAEAQIHDNSSWSCVHGVERWRSDCGCNTGMHQHWNQKWREPLRNALNELRDELNTSYNTFMKKYTPDPWGARNAYINVILNRSEESRRDFYAEWLKKPAYFEENPDEEVAFLEALEIQRHLMLMFTSCAWFFDELSGIETVQNLQYAYHAIELAKKVLGEDLEKTFADNLSFAPSNIAEFDNGRNILDRFVKPAKVGYPRIAAHYAVCRLFHDNGEDERIYCFTFEPKDTERHFSGKAQLLCGHMDIVSCITFEREPVDFCALHLGDHNINVGVRPHTGVENYTAMKEEFVTTFERGDVPECVRLLDKYFENKLYSLKDLFKDQQKIAIDHVLESTLETLEKQFVGLHEQYYAIMCYLSDLGVGLPSVFVNMSEYVQNRRIKGALAEDEIPFESLRRYLDEAENWKTDLDRKGIEKYYNEALNRLFEASKKDPDEIETLEQFASLLEARHWLPFQVDLGPVQNEFYTWTNAVQKAKFARNKDWKDVVHRIAEELKVRIPV